MGTDVKSFWDALSREQFKGATSINCEDINDSSSKENLDLFIFALFLIELSAVISFEKLIFLFLFLINLFFDLLLINNSLYFSSPSDFFKFLDIVILLQ